MNKRRRSKAKARRKALRISLMCGRCGEPVNKLFPATCPDPRQTFGAIGMYHCDECGTMVLAGFAHPGLCFRCANGIHPAYDLLPGREVAN